jgi:hypothetical protein
MNRHIPSRGRTLFGDICTRKAFYLREYKMLAGMPKEKRQVGGHEMNEGESEI